MILESLSYIFYTVTQLFSQVTLKLFAACCVVVGNFLFGLDHEAALKALLFLVFVDTFTGVIGAKLSKEEIKSAKFFRVALKTVVYYLLIAAAFNTEKLISPTFFLDEAVLAFIGATELISIIENSGKMGFVVPNKLLNKLHELRDD